MIIYEYGGEFYTFNGLINNIEDEIIDNIKDDFDDYLNDIHTDIILEGIPYEYSTVLKLVDLVSYNESCNDWMDGKLTEFIDSIEYMYSGDSIQLGYDTIYCHEVID